MVRGRACAHAYALARGGRFFAAAFLCSAAAQPTPRSWWQPTYLFSANCAGSATLDPRILPSSAGTCSKGEDGKSAKGTCSADGTRMLYDVFDRENCSGPVADTGWLAMAEVHKYVRGQCATWRGPGLSEPQTMAGLGRGAVVSSKPNRPLVAGVDYPRCASPGLARTAASADTRSSGSASESNESKDGGGGTGAVSIVLVLLFMLLVLVALAYAEDVYLESSHLAPMNSKVVAILRATTARCHDLVVACYECGLGQEKGAERSTLVAVGSIIISENCDGTPRRSSSRSSRSIDVAGAESISMDVLPDAVAHA